MPETALGPQAADWHAPQASWLVSLVDIIVRALIPHNYQKGVDGITPSVVWLHEVLVVASYHRPKKRSCAADQ